MERAKGFEPSTSTLARLLLPKLKRLFLIKLYTFYTKIKRRSGTRVGHGKTIPYLHDVAKINSLDSSSSKKVLNPVVDSYGTLWDDFRTI